MQDPNLPPNFYDDRIFDMTEKDWDEIVKAERYEQRILRARAEEVGRALSVVEKK